MVVQIPVEIKKGSLISFILNSKQYDNVEVLSVGTIKSQQRLGLYPAYKVYLEEIDEYAWIDEYRIFLFTFGGLQIIHDKFDIGRILQNLS